MFQDSIWKRLLCVVALVPLASFAFNNALHFDGSNDSVRTSLKIPATAFTVEAWVKPDAVTGDQAIASTLNITEVSGFELHLSSGMVTLTVRDAGWYDWKATTAIVAGEWSHIAASYDKNAGTAKIYVNGQEMSCGQTLNGAATTNLATSYVPGTTPLILGNRTGNVLPYGGRIDELKILSTVRSGSEISSDMKSITGSGPAGLLGYFPFDQGTSVGDNHGVDSLYDQVAGKMTGALVGFALQGARSNWVSGFHGTLSTTPVAVAPQGTGTESDPYQIDSLPNLYWISQTSSVWEAGTHFRQTRDIDASATRGWTDANGNKGFPAIGGISYTVNANYHGGGHQIQSLYQKTVIPAHSYEYDPYFYQGLWANFGGTVDSLGLVDIDLSLDIGNFVGYPYFGGLAGQNSGTISYCFVTGSIVEFNSSIFAEAGGVAGVNTGTIQASYSTADITGGASVGGLVGTNSSHISSSYFSTGALTVAAGAPISFLGGIAGNQNSSDASVSNSYATGILCSGACPASTVYGGLVATNSGVLDNNYWDLDATHTTNATGDGSGAVTAVIGQSTAAMKTQAQLANLGSFTDTWYMVEGQTYPLLRSLFKKIDFQAMANDSVGHVFDPGASTHSAYAVQYQSSNPAVAGIVNGKIQVNAVGTATITAFTHSPVLNYDDAFPVSQVLTVLNTQRLIFPAIATKKVGDADFAPASVSSGLPITYSSSNLSVATIVNNRVHIVAEGTATITATQSGGGIYNSVTAEQILTVDKLPTQTNNALGFDGVDDYVTRPLASVSNNLALEAWVKPASLQSNQYIASVWGSFGSGVELVTGTSGNIRMKVQYYGSSDAVNGDVFETSDAILVVGQWIHLVASCGDRACKLYANGQLKGTVSVGSESIWTAGIGQTFALTLGKRDHGFDITSKYFNGSIDEVQLWSVARSEAEIQSDMYGYETAQTGLQHYYHLDQGIANADNSLSTAHDLVAGDDVASLNNFALKGSSSNWVKGVGHSVITFPEMASRTLDSADFDPGAQASNGATVVYTSSDPTVASIVNNKVHILSQGRTSITASPDADYFGASVTRELTVTKGSVQTSNALAFDGVDDYGQGTPTLISNDFTIAAYVKPTAIQADQAFVSTLQPANTGVELHVNAGQVILTVGTGSAYKDVIVPAGALEAGKWSHVAGTCSNLTCRVYVNGKELAKETLASQAMGTTPLTLGRRAPGGNFYKGILDEVQVWSAARTEAQIQADMGGYTVSQPGLQNYYDLNQGVANAANEVKAAYDLVGNANNVKLNNFAMTGTSSNWVDGIALIAQTITFNPMVVKTLESEDSDPHATASSRLPVRYASSDTTVVRIVEGKVHILSQGTVEITAFQDGGFGVGNEFYKSAPAVSKTLTVLRGSRQTNNALAFDGVDDSLTGVSVPAVTGLTLEAWIKPTTVDKRQAIASSWITEFKGMELSVEANGQLALAVGIGNGFVQVFASPGAVAAEVWTHVAASCNGTSFSLYVNGEKVASQSVEFAETALKLALGASGASNYYEGVIDEVQLWNTARTQDQIKTDMKGYATAQPGLLLYEKFDQGTANGDNTVATVYDVVGNGTSAFLQNFALSGTISNWVKGVPAVQATATVEFVLKSSVVYGDSITLQATVSSGLPVRYISGNEDIVMIYNGKAYAKGVGTATLTAIQDANADYLISTQTADITITPATLAMAAPSFTLQLGIALPTTFDFTYSGFVNGDDASALEGLTASYSCGQCKTAGKFSIVPYAKSANYEMLFVNGVLTLNAPTRILDRQLPALNLGNVQHFDLLGRRLP